MRSVRRCLLVRVVGIFGVRVLNFVLVYRFFFFFCDRVMVEIDANDTESYKCKAITYLFFVAFVSGFFLLIKSLYIKFSGLTCSFFKEDIFVVKILKGLVLSVRG